jgi:hypothetical protein
VAPSDGDILLQQRGSVLVRGRSVGEKISHGPVRLIKDVHHLQAFQGARYW